MNPFFTFLYFLCCGVFSLPVASFDILFSHLVLTQYQVPGNDLVVFKALPKVDIDQCLDHCKRRDACTFINYHVLAHVCFMIRSRGSTVPAVSVRRDARYIFGDKTQWNMDAYSSCNQCSNIDECVIKPGNVSCVVSLCPFPPEVPNTEVLGNVNTVGSILLYKCVANFTMETNARTSSVVCKSDGTWSDVDFFCQPITTSTTSSTTTTPKLVPAPVCPSALDSYETVYLSDGTVLTYMVVTTPYVQRNAILNCQNTQNGTLMAVLTLAKMNFMFFLMDCSVVPTVDYWIDGSNSAASDPGAPDAWKTSTGEQLPMSKDFWTNKTPNNVNVEHCVRLRASRGHKLDNRECYYTFFSLCEK